MQKCFLGSCVHGFLIENKPHLYSVFNWPAAILWKADDKNSVNKAYLNWTFK